MVNILVTCGSPMTSLFLLTVLNWKLQEMLQKLNQATLEVRLSMNLKKTKVMYDEFAENVEEPNTDSNKIDEVVTSASVNTSPWIPPRRNKRSNVVSPSDCKLSVERARSSKTKTFHNQHILPTVTYLIYVSETQWNRKKQQTLKLRIIQRDHERIIVNITWRNRKTAQWIRNQSTRYNGND